MEDSKKLEKEIAELLWKMKLTVSCAESCTGGLISHRLTNIAGASYYFDAGIVSYSNESKIKILGVKLSSLLNYGAVSEEVAKEMAKGVKDITGADIGIAVSGIAGPGGGSEEKPVGLVYIAVDFHGNTQCEKHLLSGEREEIKQKASDMALILLKKMLKKEIK